MKAAKAIARAAAVPIVLVGSVACEAPDGPSGATSACERYCEAARMDGCPEDPRACDERCSAFAATWQADSCGTAYSQLFSCLARSPFRCEDGAPVAVDACAPETAGVSDCLALASCPEICDRAQDEGCGDLGCTERCARRFEDERCIDEASRSLACEVEHSACHGEEVRPDAVCRQVVVDLAYCESWLQPCRSYCRRAQLEGCSGTVVECEASCEAQRSSDCGHTYSAVIDCRMRSSFTCRDGTVEPSEKCAYEDEDLAACLR